MDPSLPVANIRTMADVVATALATPRLTGFLLGTFAAIALALAAVGIYGVLAYLVAQRTHEIGIRLAIGADRSQVLRMILKQGLSLATIGIVVGLVAAFGLTRLMQSLLYEVGAADPATFIIVPLALLVVALVASYFPARRATHVPPTIALRQLYTGTVPVERGQSLSRRVTGAVPVTTRDIAAVSTPECSKSVQPRDSIRPSAGLIRSRLWGVQETDPLDLRRRGGHVVRRRDRGERGARAPRSPT